MNIFREINIKFDVPGWQYCLEQKYINDNTNGCGDKFTDWCVPDKPFDLNFTFPCIIHDLDYHYIIQHLKNHGITKKRAKELTKEANKRFFKNMKIEATALRDKNLLEANKGNNAVWSIYFWKTEKWQVNKRYREHIWICKKYYKGAKFGGWSSIERSLKS